MLTAYIALDYAAAALPIQTPQQYISYFYIRFQYLYLQIITILIYDAYGLP
jgi:hypothetical protein